MLFCINTQQGGAVNFSQILIQVEAPSNLAEWFKTDPVERIVLHEKALRRTNSYTVDEDKW